MDDELKQALIDALLARASVFFLNDVQYSTMEVALYFMRKT